MKAMLLTAGLGTRLRPVTDLYAKPAVPFLNIPLALYPFGLLHELSISTFVMNTHYKAAQVEQLAQLLTRTERPVLISPEPSAPLGSGGGIWNAKRHLDGAGDFIVCNGDEVILPLKKETLSRFVNAHTREQALATILVMRHPLVGTQFGGVWADSQGHVAGFGKDRTQFPGTEGFHYIGLLLLNERIFTYLPEGESNILYDALTAAIAQGEKVRMELGEFTWFETGNPGDFLEASGHAIELLRPVPEITNRHDSQELNRICRHFWEPGTTLRQTKEGALVLLAPNCSIVRNHTFDQIQFDGFAVVGSNVQVEPGSRISKSVLLPGANVRGLVESAIVLPN